MKASRSRTVILLCAGQFGLPVQLCVKRYFLRSWLRLLLRAPRKTRAREEFEWMRRRNPRHSGVYLKLGHVEWRAGRARLAKAYYRRALDLDPGLEEARKMLAPIP